MRDFGDLRDPDRVRTQFQGRIEVNLLQATTTESGQVIEVRIENADTSDPFATLGETSVGWVLEDGNGREFEVNAVHKLHELDPVVELAGSNEPPVTALLAGDRLTGTMGFTEGSAAVVGVATLFLTEVSPGDYVAPTIDGVVSKVLSVADDLNLELELPYSGDTIQVTEATVTQSSRGLAILRPPALIRLLGQDFGLDVDTHEPEAFQRSSIHDITQWIGIKGSQKSYDVIGKIAGYRIETFGLWRIDPVPDSFPTAQVFELPAGSGKFYTSIDPSRPFFDDFPADTIPLDYFCFEEPLWTTNAITPPDPSPPDGTSIEDAIALEVQGLPIISTTDLGNSRWEIRVGPGVDMNVIIQIGHWFADFPGLPGSKVYLETLPQEVVPGEWTFEVMAGLAPTFGPTVDINYECRNDTGCGYCRASLLRVEITPVEVLADPDALLDGVLGRLVDKIGDVIPIHVRITDVVHIVDAQATLDLAAQGCIVRVVTAPAMVGYYYDILPADELPADQDHMIATGSVSTTP